MIDINKFDYFIFDCDGVILDSNKLKSRAFAETLTNDPSQIVAEFVEYHKKNGGISRYEKFRYYFEEMKKSTSSKKDIEIALNSFASIVKNGLLECNYISGVLEFINRANKNKQSMFIVSGSDENELKDVFSQRGISHLFEKVYGSPSSKLENTRKVKKVIGANKKGIFFGDSKSDFIAATKYDLHFVFVRGVSEWVDGDRLNIKKGNMVIDDFTDIKLKNTRRVKDITN